MDIVEATKDYEAWAGGQIALLRADLALKHKRMNDAAFPFLRATFYRWVQLWRDVCGDLAEGPRLLAVGDLHVENFGTWRDAEGRLVWGINDFDEACRMPYAIDLVRLGTSAILARREQGLAIAGRDACAAILAGYTAALASGGGAFVLEEGHAKLRRQALGAERDPQQFWAKLARWPAVKSVPAEVRRLLRAHLPGERIGFRVVHRVAGLGSLGRQRFVAIAAWQDGQIAREAKALMPSAYGWARGKVKRRLHYNAILERSLRCRDPFVLETEGWLVRRIGPHCSRIELSDLPARRDERHLLEAMGRETANVHLGTPEAVAAVRADLRRRKPAWLHEAAQAMAEATLRDWKDWRARR